MMYRGFGRGAWGDVNVRRRYGPSRRSDDAFDPSSYAAPRRPRAMRPPSDLSLSLAASPVPIIASRDEARGGAAKSRARAHAIPPCLSPTHACIRSRRRRGAPWRGKISQTAGQPRLPPADLNAKVTPPRAGFVAGTGEETRRDPVAQFDGRPRAAAAQRPAPRQSCVWSVPPHRSSSSPPLSKLVNSRRAPHHLFLHPSSRHQNGE